MTSLVLYSRSDETDESQRMWREASSKDGVEKLGIWRKIPGRKLDSVGGSVCSAVPAKSQSCHQEVGGRGSELSDDNMDAMTTEVERRRPRPRSG